MERVDEIDQEIAALFVKFEADTGNADLAKAIGALLAQKEDYPSAILWYEHAFKAGGCVDSALESIVNDLSLKSGSKSESS